MFDICIILIVICLLYLFYFKQTSTFVASSQEIKKLFNYNDLQEFQTILQSPITRAQYDEFCQLIDNNPYISVNYNNLAPIYCPAECYTMLDDLNIESSALDQAQYGGIKKNDPNLISYIKDAENYVAMCQTSGSQKPDITKTQIYKDFVTNPIGCIPRYRLGQYNNMNPTSYSANPNLIDFCQNGVDILDSANNCSPDTKNAWKSDPGFQKMCCSNGSCSTDNFKLAMESSDFENKDYGFQNFNLPSASANQISINNYCNLGNKLIKAGINIPSNSATFKQICCTSSQGCDDGSTYIKEGNFASEDYNLQNFNISSASANQTAINTYCNLGNHLINIGINTPSNSNTFKKICCSSPQGCDDGTTIINEGNFASEDYNFQNFNINSISGNLGAIENYCSLGYDLISQGITTPENSPQFLKLCCGGQPGNCGQTQFECLTNAGTFFNIDPTMQNINPTRYSDNAVMINNYCNSANYLNQNCSTTLANPSASNAFHNLCCNSITGCNNQGMQCNIDNSTLQAKAYDLQNINPPSIPYNIGSGVGTYCSLANKQAIKCSNSNWINSNLYKLFQSYWSGCSTA